LVDRNDVVIGLLYGIPPGKPDEFLEKTWQIHEKLLELERQVKKVPGTRGKFKALNAGISFGGGQQVGHYSVVHPTTRTHHELASIRNHSETHQRISLFSRL
jgi:hypothetical protein